MIGGHGLSFLNMSLHAKQWWMQRCNHLDILDELSTLRRANKAIINTLRRSWERSHGVGTWPAHYGYYTSRGGALFIMGDKQQIITVMLVKEVKKWRVRRAEDDRMRRRHALL